MSQVEWVDGHMIGRPISQNPVRTAVRFPMRLDVTLYTDHGVHEAYTENVSANGLLFVCDFIPDVDAKIEFTMTMPSAIMGSDKDLSIHCIGRIVRHVHDGEMKKAAVVIDEYSLRA